MTSPLREALAAVREGRETDAEAIRRRLAGLEIDRLDLALAHRRGQRERALEIAARLWWAVEVDATVLAVLVHHRHPELHDLAAALLQRCTSDATHDTTAAWHDLIEWPGDLEAWREVICSLVATGHALEAVDGVARALSDRCGDFALWLLLVTALMTYRRRRALALAIELGRRAFPGAPDMLATCGLIHIGLGDLAIARAELAAIGEHARTRPIVVVACTAMREVRGG